jgi:hypothetical protein
MSKNILIVIGAGASKDIHSPFPTGIELAQLIDVHLITTKKEQDDPTNTFECPYISPMINEVKRAFQYDQGTLDLIIDSLKRPLWGYVQTYYYELIRTGAPPISIDDLITSIESPQKDKIIDVAKYCIAYHLKGQEQACFETFEQKNNWETSWVYHLCELIVKKGLSVENVSVTSFNYERTFEFFSTKALEKMNNPDKFSIDYIYGRLGSLKEMNYHAPNDDSELLRKGFSNIRLIGDRADASCKHKIEDFEKILFLGFGFDKKNLEEALCMQKPNKIPSFGMCRRSKSDYLCQIEKDYSIIIEEHASIKAFLTEHI